MRTCVFVRWKWQNVLLQKGTLSFSPTVYTSSAARGEAAPEVSKGDLYIKQKKNVPIESFVTTASDFPVSHLIEPFF